MKKIYALLVISFVFSGANAQTACPNISIDDFSGIGCALDFTNADPLNTVKQVECTGLTGTISGAADIWMQKQSPAGGGTTASAGYYGTGQFDYSSGASNISSFSITYDGADGNTDPDDVNITGPVLGDFTNKTIQFLATIDDIGAGKFITFSVSVWDGAGFKSEATITLNGPRTQITDLNYNLGVLIGKADLTDIRAIQFKQVSNQNGMDNSITQLSAVCVGNTPLPVTLTKFSGSYGEGNVDLGWSTSSESNASHFEIETSRNGKNFIKLGDVLAKGNSSSTTSYSFRYINSSFDNAYFRLKMIDNDGTFSYSRIISVQSKSDDSGSFNVFPTIFGNELTISLPGTNSSTAVVRIIGMNGNIHLDNVYNINNNNSVEITDLNTVPSGLYIVHITSGSLIEFKKVIKQ
ncbi:T9SS type A sorting domain-containing protein [Dyadobacter subterraneus]|uniref:T9SS type A sorting domain-containing protein n=1 Tax=Dyadobacter subterraneus TaxID=2773304 RepID=A0ABR9W556_9BACT|nr:T9SS type A sorting domain-containing protein [Dyadobacter subterraneus]MBE9460570.1 T9SS type A sorting domain-containing protein [Dyadobacter subterraneus]